MSPTTIGVNLLWLVPSEVGGSEQSTLASLRAFHELAPPDLDLRLFVLAPFAAAHPDVVAMFPTEVLPRTGRSRVARTLAEATWLARRTRGMALVHHAGGTAPFVRTAPYVLTVHDLQPLEREDTHGPVKRAYLHAVVPRSVRRAREVAVPSEFVRQSALRLLDADPAAVVTIPHGVAWPSSTTVATPGDELRRRHDLPGPVVLYPAITYPHKDHATLVEAFALVHAVRPAARLVLTGGVGSMEADLAARIDRLGLRAAVHRLGRVSEADLLGLYGVADLVAVPSTYEGFGLPAAEAMAAGVPLVASGTTALPEVVGEAGVLVAPGDVPAWAAAISALLDDPARRARMAELGRQRVQRYTWRANAEGFADLYRRALGAR